MVQLEVPVQAEVKVESHVARNQASNKKNNISTYLIIPIGSIGFTTIGFALVTTVEGHLIMFPPISPHTWHSKPGMLRAATSSKNISCTAQLISENAAERT